MSHAELPHPKRSSSEVPHVYVLELRGVLAMPELEGDQRVLEQASKPIVVDEQAWLKRLGSPVQKGAKKEAVTAVAFNCVRNLPEILKADDSSRENGLSALRQILSTPEARIEFLHRTLVFADIPDDRAMLLADLFPEAGAWAGQQDRLVLLFKQICFEDNFRDESAEKFADAKQEEVDCAKNCEQDWLEDLILPLVAKNLPEPHGFTKEDQLGFVRRLGRSSDLPKVLEKFYPDAKDRRRFALDCLATGTLGEDLVLPLLCGESGASEPDPETTLYLKEMAKKFTADPSGFNSGSDLTGLAKFMLLWQTQLGDAEWKALLRSLAQEALTKKDPARLLTLVKAGVDVKSYVNQGIGTKGNNRSILHQVALSEWNLYEVKAGRPKQKKVPACDELIQQLQSQGCDLLTHAEVTNSQVVADFVQLQDDAGDAPVLFYGFEAMRTPFVSAVKEKTSRKSDATRMLDLWPVFGRFVGPNSATLLDEFRGDDAKFVAALEAFGQTLIASKDPTQGKFGKELMQIADSLKQGPPSLPPQSQQKTPAERAVEFLRFLSLQPANSLTYSSPEPGEADMGDGRPSARVCKLGLDWVHAKGGKIAALLDDVSLKEVLDLGDLKDRRRFGDDESVYQRRITYSEIRHMLKHWDKFAEKQTITFYHRGAPLPPDEVTNLVEEFRQRRVVRRQRRGEAREALKQLDAVASIQDFQGWLDVHGEMFQPYGTDFAFYKQQLDRLANATPETCEEIQDLLKRKAPGRLGALNGALERLVTLRMSQST